MHSTEHPLRVAVLNDYSIPEAMRLTALGQYPAHHTWGVSLLDKLGGRCVLAPSHGSGLKGSLRNQLALWWRQHQFDVVYAACQSETWLLARLRRIGLFRRPLVAVIHHPITGRVRGGRAFVTGHDRLLFLSRQVCDQTLVAYPEMAGRCEAIDWGVDLDFYDQLAPPAHALGHGYFISAGKANRDHDALATCAIEGRHPTVIVCSANTKPSAAPDPHVTVVHDESGHAATYTQLTGMFRDARAIVIPLKDVGLLAGLTSLLDAMACGKPVIMTRNAFVDLDIEAHGFGMWVPAGDQAALRHAMDRLAQDDQLTHDMGCKARAFAQAHYSYGTFSSHLMTVLRAATLGS